MNQHRLIIDKSVVEWDYASNKDEAPEKRLLYMLFYQMSRMCREKFAIRHDDRLDSLAQGVKYFTDAMGISAQEVVNQRKKDDWNDLLEGFLDNPETATNHLVLGFDIDQRRQARGLTKTTVPNWV